MNKQSKSTVTLKVALKSKAGNIIAKTGTYDVVERDGNSVTIKTPDHYAGIGMARFALRASDVVEGR